jgi:inward rectifier potassium channel
MKKHKPKRVRVTLAGQNITKVGVRRRGFRDAYHSILALSWQQFFLWIVAAYMALNIAFAFVYAFDPSGIANASGSFRDYLFFSIETFSTVGYGHMYPVSTFAHVTASIEMFTGLLGVALVTGLIFARFSRPRAKILFSDVAVITTFDGVPTLMIRAANERHNLILEADVAMILVRSEVSPEGHSFRRQHDLDLLRHHSAAFTLSWTIMHPITKDSPLHGFTPEGLLKDNVFIAVSIRGLDDILEQTVHARGEYLPSQIRFNHRFSDVLVSENGEAILDLTRFHDTVPD